MLEMNEVHGWNNQPLINFRFGILILDPDADDSDFPHTVIFFSHEFRPAIPAYQSGQIFENVQKGSKAGRGRLDKKIFPSHAVSCCDMVRDPERYLVQRLSDS